jgi:hypothetical protein
MLTSINRADNDETISQSRGEWLRPAVTFRPRV